MRNLRLKMVIALLAVGPMTVQAQPVDEQAEQFTPEFRKIHTTYDAKHSPKIEAPDSEIGRAHV